MPTPPDFSAGQILTAAQMNAVGLWLVDTRTFTSANTFDMSLPADYDNFRLIIKVSGVSTTLTQQLQLLNNTTPAATNYNWYIFGGPNLENTAGTTVVKLGGSFSSVPEMSASLDIIDAGKALRTEFFGHTWGSTSAGGLLLGGLVANHTTTTAYNGIRITTSTGTMTGVAKLYGYRN
jgi:hypothetical protein